MSAISSLCPQIPIVARLRAAGCVFAEDEARLLAAAAATPDHLEAMVDRRVAGLPLEQILGWAEFCGLRIAVDPGVFVPAAAPSSSPVRRRPSPTAGRLSSISVVGPVRWASR